MDDEGNEPFGTLTAPERGLEREEARDEILGAIDRLTEQERTAVTLYYREDLRLQEMSAIMNLSPSRISRILSKAMFELGEILKFRRHELASVA